MIDIKEFEQFLSDACAHYEYTAPTVSNWADDLYMRLSTPKEITLFEIMQILRLEDNGEWEHPNFAANRCYKVYDTLGFDTTGMAGF